VHPSKWPFGLRASVLKRPLLASVTVSQMIPAGTDFQLSLETNIWIQNIRNFGIYYWGFTTEDDVELIKSSIGNEGSNCEEKQTPTTPFNLICIINSERE